MDDIERLRLLLSQLGSEWIAAAYVFGSYLADRSKARDIDLLLVMQDDARTRSEEVISSIRDLVARFAEHSDKPLHITRLLKRECDEVRFVEESHARLIWTEWQGG